MPPIFMLLIVIFAVVMVMFGNNPMERMRKEQEKYGKDPLAREIYKFNERQEKGAGSGGKYQPPEGATVYRLPQSEIIPNRKQDTYTGVGGEKLVRPAPEVPMEQWGSPYPSYMLAPKNSAQSEMMSPDASVKGAPVAPGRAPTGAP